MQRVEQTVNVNQAVNSGVSTTKSHTTVYTSILTGVFGVRFAVLLLAFVDMAVLGNRIFGELSNALTRTAEKGIVWALFFLLVYHLLRHLLCSLDLPRLQARLIGVINSVYAFSNWMGGCAKGAETKLNTANCAFSCGRVVF